MPKPQPRRHALLQARALAAVGLISVGGGIGLALMLARTLVWVGFAVALASELSVFWIYSDALRLLYRTVTKRTPYRGPTLKEVAFATSMAVLMIGISTAVFAIAVAELPPAGRADLEYATIEFTKVPQSASVGSLNVQIKNSGTLAANRINLAIVGHVRPQLIAQDVLNNEMKALEDFVIQSDRQIKADALGSQLRPGMASLISLQDINPASFPDIIGKKMTAPPAIHLTDDQWSDFVAGKSVIYVLYATHYEDEAHAGSFWKASNCLYFISTTTYWHNCGANRIDLARSSR